MNRSGRATAESRSRRSTLLSLWFAPVCLLAGCINSGSAPTYEEEVAAQEAAAADIKSRGKVETKQYPLGTGTVVALTGATITDADIESLRRINNLAELDLSGATITDAQLARLVEAEPTGRRPTSHLFRVNISGTPITDTGFKALTVLDILADINVKGSKVSDAALNEFKKSRSGRRLPGGLRLKITK